MTPRKSSTPDAQTDNAVESETSKKQSPAPKSRAATKTATPAKARAGQSSTAQSAPAEGKTTRPRKTAAAKDGKIGETGTAKSTVAGKKSQETQKAEEPAKAEKASGPAESAPVATGKGSRAKSRTGGSVARTSGSTARAGMRTHKTTQPAEAGSAAANAETSEAGVEKIEAGIEKTETVAVSEKRKTARPKSGRAARSRPAADASQNDGRVAGLKSDTGDAGEYPATTSPGPEATATTVDGEALAARSANATPEKAVTPGRGTGRGRKKSVPAKTPAAPTPEKAQTPQSPPSPQAAQTPQSPSAPQTVPALQSPPAPQAAPVSQAAMVPQTAPALSEAASTPATAPADFSFAFDDFNPESGFAAQESEIAGDESDAEQGLESGAKKRRSRSRRGGRGRKKAQVAPEAAAAESAGSTGSTGGDKDAEHKEVIEQFEIVDTAVANADSDDDSGPTPLSGSKDVKSQGAGKRKMFVCVLPAEQIEVVVTEEGQVQEYYVEMLHQAKVKGNIYKATVHNVDPNLQAAFVNYGAAKNGFLQIDEVHPEYFVAPHDATKGRKYPLIQKVLKPGQELLVQVVKEPAGSKGAFLTTYLSMPGRFLVLTPGREQIGVSRKVEDEGERARLRELLEGLSPGPGLGVIVRTVSMGASKTSLQRDLQFLKRTWKEVRARGTTEKSPSLVYQEMDLTSRAVRDYLTDAIGEVWIDDQETARTVTEIAEALFPRKQNLVRFHKDHAISLFERFNLQRQLDQIHSREVSLPSGGRLVIDPTEALTAIDINSGRSSGKSNFEDMAYRTNMEAAKMIPLQLRLRDIGGQVVADFIEMRDKSHWREVEKTLRNAMKIDRARYDVGKISSFGLLEIVRQRLGSSAISISTEPCPCCHGTGMRRNMEWQSQSALREILRLLRNAQAHNLPSVTYETVQGVAMHLLNHKRERLLDMEELYGVRLDINISLSAQVW